MINIFHFSTEEAEDEERLAKMNASQMRSLQNINMARKLKGLEPQEDEEDEEDGELGKTEGLVVLDVRNLRQQFQDNIIRRDLRSRGEDGHGSITGLKDFWTSVAYLKLTEEEYTVIKMIEDDVEEEQMEDGRTSGINANDLGIVSSMFRPTVCELDTGFSASF